MQFIKIISLFIFSIYINIGYCGNAEVDKYNDETVGEIGLCSGVFNVASNTAAYNNNEGQFKIYTLHFSRAYTSYSAIKINKGRKNVDATKKINLELHSYAALAEDYFKSKPSDLIPKTEYCSKLINKIFADLNNDGVSIEKDGDLLELASVIASNKRKDLGFK